MKSPEQIEHELIVKKSGITAACISLGISTFPGLPQDVIEKWRQRIIRQEIAEHMIEPFDTGINPIRWSDLIPSFKRK